MKRVNEVLETKDNEPILETLIKAEKKKEEAKAAKTKADDEKAAAAAALAKSKEMTHAANKYSYWTSCHTDA